MPGNKAVAPLSVCRSCPQNLEASFYEEKGLSTFRAGTKVRMITTLGMTHLHRLLAKPVFLRQVSQARRTTANVRPHQKSSSSLTETMPLIQETL